jgi:hypothetical protein
MSDWTPQRSNDEWLRELVEEAEDRRVQPGSSVLD